MSLPPEHISIKRRRQEEPVELLYLENDRHQTKRRFTDYCFQRVTADTQTAESPDRGQKTDFPENQWAASSHGATGIPVVRATSPGEEIRDEAKRRTAQQKLRDRYLPRNNVVDVIEPALNRAGTPPPEDIAKERPRSIVPTRRFHLHHSHKLNQFNRPSAIQKRKSTRRNYLATFVERSEPSRRETRFHNNIASRNLVNDLQPSEVESTVSNHLAGESLGLAMRPPPKLGRSMHDHPSTWDYNSDQLARELAAFALEISQNEEQEKHPSTHPNSRVMDTKDSNVTMDEDFVYDTYIRVPMGARKSQREAANNVGLLVIDDEDQELWQTFVESDSDSEWDEDDPDSNAEDNPANDYPDEEIDSGDEYAYGAYKHRRYASDNEEYDLNDP